MRIHHNVKVIIITILSTSVIHIVNSQTVTHSTSQDDLFNSPTPRTTFHDANYNFGQMSAVRTKGVCRDGWTPGTMRDVSGADIPICLKVNTQPQTWDEAKASCRKDYGFLLKLDSVANWDDEDLMSVLFEEGITKTWTGVHTGYSRLVWDDLVPSQVSPSNSQRNSSSSLRPWKWDSGSLPKQADYCGFMDIKESSNDRRKRASSFKRRKRAIEEDNPDILGNFDFSNLRDRIMESSFKQPSPVINFPRTSPFKSMLTRAQMSDQLPELPSTSLGIESELQIPGTGLSGANIQDGGLSATIPPTLDSLLQPDKDENKEGIPGFESTESNKELTNIMNTEDVGQLNEFTALETLRDHFNEMQNIQSDLVNSDNTPPAVDLVNEMKEGIDSTFKFTTPSPLDAIKTDISDDDKNGDNTDGFSLPVDIVDKTSEVDINGPVQVLLESGSGAHDSLRDFTSKKNDTSNDFSDLIDKVSNMLDVLPMSTDSDTKSETITTHTSTDAVTEVSTVTSNDISTITDSDEDETDKSSDSLPEIPSTDENSDGIDTVTPENIHSDDKVEDVSNNNFPSTDKSYETSTVDSEKQSDERDAQGMEIPTIFGENKISDDKSGETFEMNEENEHKTTPFSEISDIETSTKVFPFEGEKLIDDDKSITPVDFLADAETKSDRDLDNDDSIADTFDDYLSHFKKTKEDDLEKNNDDNKENADFVNNEVNTDTVTDVYDDFMKSLSEKENETQDDKDENNSQDIFPLSEDDDETLLASIRETQNAILGKNDETDDSKNESSERTILENNFDDANYDSGFTESPYDDHDDITERNKIEKESDNSDMSDVSDFQNDYNEKFDDLFDDKMNHKDSPDEDFRGDSESNNGNENNKLEESNDETEAEQTNSDDFDDMTPEDYTQPSVDQTDDQEKDKHLDMEENDTFIEKEDREEFFKRQGRLNDPDDDIVSAGEDYERKDNDDIFPTDHEDLYENGHEEHEKNVEEIEEEMRDFGNLEEVVTSSNTKIPLRRTNSNMVLSSCEARLPSVCFSYEVEVMSKASTCDEGWYGHVLLDTCFKILDEKMTYAQAELSCSTFGARVVLGDSEFQRRFVLMAVQKDGKFFRGENFWKESVLSQQNRCRYFNERDSNIETSCNTALRVVCVKDAKSLTVHTIHDDLELEYYPTGNEENVELISKEDSNVLHCDLTSAASEFPVLWFKDGVLVKTIDKYVASDISLHLNDRLVDVISHFTNRNISMPVLQGKYWCEVWDRKSLTRKRSTGYDIRFTDVISFHGSMELRGFTLKQEVLFNMVNEKFESLIRTEMDIRRVFQDVLPRLQRYSPDITSVYTFADGVRSRPKVIEYHTYFTLNRNYTVGDEDFVYKRLKALLRSQLGNRRYMASLEGGTPLQAFRTMSLQSTVSCPATTLQTNKDLFGKTIPRRAFSFPKALLGEFANSLNNCSERLGQPAGTARCLGDFQRGAYWGDVVANECIDERRIDDINKEIWGTSPFTQQLSKISEQPVNKKNVQNVVQEIAHIADVAVKFTPSDINKIADILDHSTQIPDLPKMVGENVVRTVNRLMEMDEKEVHMANLETQAANRILQSVDRFADNIDLEKKENMRLVTDNVVVEIWDLKPNSRPVIGLAAETQIKDNLEKPFKTEKIATVFESSQLYDIDVDAAIELPKEVFTQKEKGENIGNRLTMVVYRKSKLFDAAVRGKNNGGEIKETHFKNLNSYIISASIAGKKISGLNDKVRTIFRPLKQTDDSRKCVWWDFMKNEFKGGWSSRGCRYDGKMNGRDVCLCDHLTNFAVLLDFYGQAEPIDDHHELSLSIITVIGLSFSILGLSLTIISYVFFKKLRQGRAQQTLFNLSLALLFSMMTFLVGIKQTHNYYICVVVAVLLHYFILVSFMWMLMEAMLQYLTFVKILGTYITRFTMKTVLPAWGLPLVPVIAVLSIDYDMYKGGPNYCWMSLQAFYYAFVIPISLIILVNIIIFFITIISIFRRGKGLRSNQKKHKMALTNLQAAITSFILLGLTWIFGYLAISDARITFQYIFTILNSLQGFFIFILFVLRKKKVRDQWYIICCKGSEKERVSRSLSASNSIPSSYSSGSRNGRSKNERDRSDSTKTVQSTFSNSSMGSFTNYGYETGFDTPFNRHDKRFFRNF